MSGARTRHRRNVRRKPAVCQAEVVRGLSGVAVELQISELRDVRSRGHGLGDRTFDERFVAHLAHRILGRGDERVGQLVFALGSVLDRDQDPALLGVPPPILLGERPVLERVDGER